MLNQKVSCWICYIDDKQSRKGGREGEWRQPPFHFRKEKVSGNKVCVKAALYSNKTSHKTYLSEGRSTFAVWTVVNKLTNQSIGVHIVIVSTIRELILKDMGNFVYRHNMFLACFTEGSISKCWKKSGCWVSAVTEPREGSGNRIPLLIQPSDLMIIFTHWNFS